MTVPPRGAVRGMFRRARPLFAIVLAIIASAPDGPPEAQAVAIYP